MRVRASSALLFALCCAAAGSVWLFSQSTTQSTLANPPPQAQAALLITLGVGDSEETAWDGSVHVSNGELVDLAGYELRPGDIIHPPRRWELRTRPAFAFQRRPHDEDILEDLPPDTYLAPRLYVYFNSTASTEIRLSTAQGVAVFRAAEIPAGGRKSFLGGRILVQDSPVPALVGRGAATPLGVRLTENDYASATVAADGQVWVAFTGYRDDADRVYAERFPAGALSPPATAPHAVSPKNGDVYRTAIAEDSEGKIWTVWSERIDDNWDLYARSFDGESWSRIERLTTASQPDAQHKLTRDSQGRLHLVWQGFRGNRAGIFYKTFTPDAGWSAEERVSAPDAPNCWEPAITAGPDDAVYVGWDQYGPDGYDVWMRPRINGAWQAPVEVAATGRFEAYVTLAAAPDGRVWLAWHESGVNWGKDWGYPFDITANATGLYEWRKMRVAVWENGRLLEPTQQLEDALPGWGPGYNFYEYPQMAVDDDGRVWCFFRHRRAAQHNVYPRTPSHHALWEIQGSYYEGGSWSPPMLLPYSTGRNDMRVDVARAPDGRLVAAYPTDRRNFRDFVNLIGDVFVTRLPAPAGQRSEPRLTELRLPPVEPGIQPPNREPREMSADEPVHPNEEQDVARAREYVYEIGGKRYRIFRGDMHRHTEISWDGYNDGSTQDTYRYAIDAAALDYLAITEHNFGVQEEYDWWRSQKFCDLFRIGNRFVPLFAYERSIPYPGGHRNVVFPFRGAPVLDYQHYEWNSGQPGFGQIRQGPERFFAYLRKYRAVAMPHTSATNMGTDWADYDPEVEPVVEIYQSDRTSYECEGCWRAAPSDDPKLQFGGYRPDGFVSKAWEKGYRLGVQASSDHLGVHTSYAMLLAEENSRESLVDAIRQRHTYGATDNIVIDFRLIDGDAQYLMGDDARISGPPLFKIRVEGTDLIGDVEVVKNNRMVYNQQPDARTVDLEYRDAETPDKEEASFFYVRVRQKDRDRQIGWSSPIWVTSR